MEDEGIIMGKYTDDCKELLKQLGGKENVYTVAHCSTRMRFVLNSPEAVCLEEIQKIKSVKGTFTQAGQFQVIIGNNVQEFFNEFTSLSGIEGRDKEQVKSDAKKNMTVVQRIVAVLAEIFSPLIPAIVIGGLILGFRNVIGEIKMFDNGTLALVEVSQFWAGVNQFLWLIGEAVFHFLPVGITWSVTKKMGTTQILGIVLGITLVSPQLLNAYSVAGAQAIPYWDFGFAKVNMIGYQAQVIPAMLAGFMLSYLEIKLRKIIPNAISMIFVPLFALVPTVLAAHVVLGPLGWSIGTALSSVVYKGLTSAGSWLFGGLFGFMFAPVVITGLHHMTNAIDLSLMAEFGGTNLWPMIALSNIAQGSAVLAVILLHKGNKEEEQISIPAMISCYLGITEPAMFGITLKYFYPFIAALTGSSLASAFSVFSGVMANSIGVGGLPGILSIKLEYWMQFAIAMLIAVVVPFTLTEAVAK